MPTLTGTKPALTYTFLLQVDEGLDGTLKDVEDGAGNSTPLQLSTNEVAVAGFIQLLANSHSVSLGLDPSAAADYTVLFPSVVAPSASYVLNVTSIVGDVMQLGWTSVMGTPGSTWYSGSGVPSGGTGINGDYYFRTSTYDIYTKTSGSWGSPIATITGPTGATGATGATGSAGTNGTAWYSGSGAPSNGTGANGDFYFQTSNGAVYKKVTGSWGSAIANLTGPTGAAGSNGTDGSTWFSGSSTPSGGTGVDGDFYFRTTTGDVYHKTSGSWSSPVANITGPNSVSGSTTTSLGAGLVYSTGAVMASDTAITTDASGHLTTASLTSNGTLSSATGKFTVDSSGNVTVGIPSTSTSNLVVTGTSSFDSGAITTDGAGGLTAHSLAIGQAGVYNGQLSVVGTTSLDNANITTDGSGNLTAASLTSTNLTISSLTGALVAASGVVSADATGGSLPYDNTASSASWASAPTSVQNALDRLANAVFGLLGGTIP